MEENYPKTWAVEKLGDVMDVQGGSQPPKAEFIYEPKDGYVQLLQIRDFGDKPVPTYVPMGRVSKFCKKTDVLIARYGASLGRIVRGLEGAYNVALAKTIYDERLFEDSYVFYLLKTPLFQTPLKMISRSAQNGFARHEIAHVELPIPPLNEQKRIVAKIEELFSELDNGIAALKTVQEQLKVYRQAILKHAFEGKLTAKWREENADKLETLEQQLARIQQERNAHYQQQLKEWNGAIREWAVKGKEGKKPLKPKEPDKIDPLLESDVQGWKQLPEGWMFLRLGVFIDKIDAGKSFKCDEREPTHNEIGVAKVSAVTWGEYDESESKTCLDAARVNSDFFIKSGDFILSRANTIELVGACVITKKVTKPIMLSDKTLRINFSGINQKYVLQYLRSYYGRNEIMERSTGNQESMRNIGQDRIKNIVIPICGGAEMEVMETAINRPLSKLAN